MTLSRTSEPFDEQALRTLFEGIQPPAGPEANWRDRAAAATPARGRRAARRYRFAARFRQATNPWTRVLAVGIATVASAGVVGVVAANRPPSPEPNPDVIETITSTPPPPSSPSLVAPPAATGSVPSSPTGAQPVPGGPGTAPALPVGQPPAPGPGPAPARGPLAEWPDASNAGLPPGTNLHGHAGDLHVTTPGAVVADLRVGGVIYVEAPDVTLRRVLVTPPWGVSGAIQQSAQAPRLRIEDSEISSGQFGVRQAAAGLTVQRSNIHDVDYAIGVTTDVTVVDSFLPGAGSRVLTNGNAARVTVRHNTVGGSIEVTDQDGPVTEVTIENNQLDFIWAPSGPGSHHIRVTGNQFYRGRPDDAAVSGWNGPAPGNTWTGNVWAGTNEPANP